MFNWLRQLISDPSDAAPSPAAQVQQAADAPAPKPCAVSPVPTRHRDQVDYIFSSWLFQAERHPDVFTNGNENAILAAIDETVKSEESGAHMVRRMPGVIPQLLQSLRNSDFSGAELARTISSDVVLVAEVLRLASGAGYGAGQSITGIDHAIMLLGQNGLRQLITGVAFKPIVNLKSGAFTRMVAPRLWLQSERCALASRILTEGGGADPLDAFLAGLVQNVGLTVSLRVIDQMSDGRQPVGSPTFCNALAASGRTLAYNIAREWHFPETVSTAIHEQGADPRNRAISPLGRILLMADYLSKMDILARQARVNVKDKEILEDLSEREIDCLEQLAAIDMRDPGTAVSAAR
jgi:HD-like signal output (HDOD) protein